MNEKMAEAAPLTSSCHALPWQQIQRRAKCLRDVRTIFEIWMLKILWSLDVGLWYFVRSRSMSAAGGVARIM